MCAENKEYPRALGIRCQDKIERSDGERKI
jgi:hypothetical protein